MELMGSHLTEIGEKEEKSAAGNSSAAPSGPITPASATDPETAPLTRRGMWLFGIGVGAITMLIRIIGEYPEGVMYSVLLMNAVTPLIDRLFQRIPTGGKVGG